MLVSRIAAVGLVAALVTIIVSTHTFVRFDATRIRVVRSPIEQRTPTVDVPVHDPRTTQLNPPFVLIARISNPRPAVQQFSILLNGSVICQRPVRPGQQSRIDCVVKEAIDPHQVTIQATTDQWTLEYLELATHYGSSIGAYELIILPASSTNFRRPPLVRVTVMWVILAATLLIPRSRSLPRWARVGHTILGTIIALVVIICLSSQWISPYRLIFSGKTVTLWFAILAFPRLWSFARWLFSTENPMEAVYVRFVRAALVAGIVAGGYGQLMVTRLQQAYDGNYSGFLQLSRKNVEQNPLLNQRGDIRRTLVLHDGGGYDGQFMYFAIFDLFLRAYHDEPVMYRQIMDAAPYRYGRIGFSLLTRILSLENWGRYPSTMMWIIVGSLAAAAMLLSLIAQDRGLTPAWGLAVLVMPGFWQSMQVALPEPLAAATLIGGIACLWYRRWTLAVVLLAFSLLVRETGIVAVFCVLAGMSLSGSARRAAWIGICACGPLIAWRLYVAYVLYPDWGIQGLLFHPPDLGLPFGGFVDLWSAVAHHTYYPQFPQMARAAIAYPLLLLSALVLAGALVANAPSPFSVAAVIYAVIAVSLNFEAIWVHVGNGQRGTYEVFVMLAVSCIAIRHSTPLKIASSMFWTACACYVLLLGFDASDIWGALPMPF